MIKANLFINLFLYPILQWFTFSLYHVLYISRLKRGNTLRTLPMVSLSCIAAAFKRLLAPWQNHSPLQSSSSLQPWAGGVWGALQPRWSSPVRAWLNSAHRSLFLPSSSLSLPAWAHTITREDHKQRKLAWCALHFAPASLSSASEVRS